jgi:MscS family membrane protein
MNIIEQIPFLNSLPPETAWVVVQLILLVITLIVIYILRRVIRVIIFTPLKRVLTRNNSILGTVIFESIERASRIVVFAFGIYITIGLFDFGENIEIFALSIGQALLIIGAFVALYGIVDIVFVNVNTVENLLSITIEERLLPFLSTVIKVVVVIIGILVILQQFGVNITALLASFGVVGLALSLAAQDTASNVFSFAAIVSDNPFKVGDYISTSDFAGTVENVGVRSTRVRKLDQTLVVVPNNALTNSAVTNWSRLNKRRLDFFLYLDYGTTLEQLKEFTLRVREMLKNRQFIDPHSVIVHFLLFGKESLDVRVICYVMLSDWNAYTAEQELINLEILEIANKLEIHMGRNSLFLENFPDYEEPAPRIKKQPGIRDTQSIIYPSDVPDQANQ